MLRTTTTALSMQDAEDAFLCELPLLLREHEGKWVAFQGARRLIVSDAKWQAYAECHDLGLRDGEFLVRCIEAPTGEMILGPDQQGS